MAKFTVPPTSVRVLVIDDGVDELAVLELVLGNEGFLVETAEGGESGLAKARVAPPDVVLLDLHMPGLDGFGVLERLKEDPRTASVSVIVVSGSADEGDVVRALELGATDYVAKPYAVEILLARMRAVLRSRREKEEIWRLGDDLRRAEDELARARRGAAIGAIAAGLAHEINNPAAFVVADLHEARELAFELAEVGEVARADALAALVDEALGGMHRIRDAVRDLSVFSSIVDRRSVPSAAAIDLAAIVRGRAERLAADADLVLRDLDAPASVAPGLGGDDELDALVGLLLRHAAAARGGAPAPRIELAIERSGPRVVLRVTPLDAVVDDPAHEWALTIAIARELAERFAGTLEPGAAVGSWRLTLPSAARS
jgi:DNA-binding response OmpR family regulator